MPQKKHYLAVVVNLGSCYFVFGTLLIIIDELIAVWVNKHLFKDSTAKTLLDVEHLFNLACQIALV